MNTLCLSTSPSPRAVSRVILVDSVKLLVHTLSVDAMEYTLTDDFCRKHFLVGVLLREVCEITIIMIV